MPEVSGAPDQDVDKLIEDIEKPTEPRQESTPSAETPVVESPWWKQEFEWNGKKVTPEREDQVRTWLSQGYNYSQRMAEVNRQRSDWEKKLAASEERGTKLSQYEKVDSYVKENPDWWKHVQESFENRKTHGLAPELQPVLQPILKELEETKSFIQSWQQEREQEQFRQADTALEQEIDSVRKSYPNTDLSSRDETGKTLELRILEHAKQIGTTSFRAAFRDLLHDQLVDLAKADGKAALAQGQVQAAKKGIIGQTPAPVKGIKPAQNVRGKGYGDLAKEALAEFGINT